MSGRGERVAEKIELAMGRYFMKHGEAPNAIVVSMRDHSYLMELPATVCPDHLRSVEVIPSIWVSEDSFHPFNKWDVYEQTDFKIDQQLLRTGGDPPAPDQEAVHGSSGGGAGNDEEVL